MYDSVRVPASVHPKTNKPMESYEREIRMAQQQKEHEELCARIRLMAEEALDRSWID
jgi:hypothetical protein